LRSKNKQRDFRKGNTASARTRQAKHAILQVLSLDGEAIFKVLMKKTGLSRPALASNLSWLMTHLCISRRIGKEDRREKHYSLTNEGQKLLAKWNYLEKVDTTETLTAEEVMGILQDSVSTLLTLVTSSPVLDISHSEITVEDKETKLNRTVPITCVGQIDNVTMPALSERARKILTNCLSSDVDFESVDKKPVGMAEGLRELLEAVNMVADLRNVDVERLKKVPILTFTFRFNRDDLIQQYEFIKNGEDDFLKDDADHPVLSGKGPR
jgi:DNA-binding MarR family transcriptional regulator